MLSSAPRPDPSLLQVDGGAFRSGIKKPAFAGKTEACRTDDPMRLAVTAARAREQHCLMKSFKSSYCFRQQSGLELLHE